MDIYKKKIELYDKINSYLNKKDCDYELIDLKYEEGEILKELNLYIVKFMTYLWEDPKLVVNLLLSADKSDIRENLALLISNNFYENILSPNYIEDHLLYVLGSLLKEEIDNIKDINDSSSFLNDSPCSIILQHLIKKKDIQSFFKIIIIKTVEKLESTYYNRDLIFNLVKIEEDIKKNAKKCNNSSKNLLKKFTKKSDIIRNSINKIEAFLEVEIGEENELYKEKYRYITKLTKEKIIEEKEKNKNEFKNDNLYDLYIKKISDEQSEIDNSDETNISKNKYDNDVFLSNLHKDENVKKIYLENFFCVIENINQIISNILENLNFLPYSVKCLCKIISILIKNKFPDINILEQNKFIGRFFFSKLLLPFFINPTFEALITNYLISQKTTKNLHVISKILVKLYSGELFKNDDTNSQYTPFNLFFIEKMPNIIKIFEKIQNIALPNFIQKLINNELPEDFKFNYFTENPDEVIFHRSICFTLDDICAILRTIGLNKEKYFNDKKNIGLKKTYEKLCSNSSQFIINEINNKQMIKRNLSLREDSIFNIKDKDIKTKNRKPSLLPTMYYFLISEILVNEKYKSFFTLEQKEPYFRIEELKTVNNESDLVQNNLIRVKNSICSILYNYQCLNKKNFSEGITLDTNQILNELKIYMKSKNYVIDETIPTQWHLNSLFESLKQIPQKYIDNDFELLYNEIENSINESISFLNFDIIINAHEKINYAKRLKTNYENKKANLRKIKINEKINNIIERESIPIELYFDYNKGILKIEKANMNYKDLDLMDDFVIEDTKKKCLICKTIKIFTNEFPNLSIYQEKQNVDLFELEKKLSLPEKLNEYLDIIKEHLIKIQIFNEKNLNLVKGKIFDYIIEKIYGKIFPKEYEIDDKIFRQSVVLTWIEPKHFLQDKNYYMIEGFQPDINNYLKKIEKIKSPKKKLNYLSKIFESINNLIKSNGDDALFGVDDQMPILNYALIKARPLRIYSNCKFMELSIGDKKNKREESELIQLLGICEFICKISYEKFNNMTKEEYDLKCKEAAKNDNNFDNEKY